MSNTAAAVADRAPAEPPERAVEVTIAAAGGPTATIATGPELQRAAMHWAWVVRNRDRWVGDGQLEQSASCRSQLAELGIDDDTLDALGRAELLQVSIPFIDEPTAWEARVFPWEYVLSSATSPDPLARSPRVVRRLVVAGEAPAAAETKVEAAAIVVSAPGQLASQFSFDSEKRLVRANLGRATVETLTDPVPSDLRAKLGEARPQLVHLAGVDSHQAAALLGLRDPNFDGYMMADEKGAPTAIPSEAVAALVAELARPRLVACNFWDSGQRTAPLIVAAGAEAAIGFQDQVDDSVAELFFATFYNLWAQNEWRTATAFEAALQKLSSQGIRLTGTGVVLWTRRDVLAERQPESSAVGSATFEVAPEPRTGAARRKPASVSPSEALSVEVRPLASLNYAQLHNNCGLFDMFRIQKHVPDPVPPIEVEVAVYVGSDSYPYRTTFAMTSPVVDLRDAIRVPLTSAVLRSFRESVQSVIYVHVQAAGETLFKDTRRVTLVPIEEWTSDIAGAEWLPSFVLPRDPAVAAIVDAAYAAVRVLRRDGEPAFDGYGSIEPNASDPNRTVHAQVKAIWATLAYQFGLRYIVPPPVYTGQSQRLRTPSEILRSRSGTCIDLALLMASCLEYVGIYPVIFLLEGHALPGYWIGADQHDDFRRVGLGETERPAVDRVERQAVLPQSAGLRVPWVLLTGDGKSPTLTEIRTRLNRPDLVALETVDLTRECGFETASANGRAHLDRGLEAMVDVQLARIGGITPLPVGIE